MTREELVAEAWQAWVKDKTEQSEDTAKGFQEGFNFCLLGKINVEGGDKGELIKDLVSELDYLSELSGISYALKLKEKTERFLKGH